MIFSYRIALVFYYQKHSVFNYKGGIQMNKTVEHEGKTYELNEDGFLEDFDEWDENWVDYIRQVEGISVLSDEHQKVFEAIHDYYEKNGIVPMIRLLPRTCGYPLKRIYELFPSGPGKGACKMAGLPKPAC